MECCRSETCTRDVVTFYSEKTDGVDSMGRAACIAYIDNNTHLDRDFVRPERSAEVDDQVQPTLAVLFAEYRYSDLLLGRRVGTSSRRTARRRARMCRAAVRVRRTVDRLQSHQRTCLVTRYYD